ncbi:rCG62218, partial [Rattus norvegicus]
MSVASVSLVFNCLDQGPLETLMKATYHPGNLSTHS